MNRGSVGIQYSSPLGGSAEQSIPAEIHRLCQANLPATPRCFGRRFLSRPRHLIKSHDLYTVRLHTLRASSTDPCIMLVQVRCITVSIPYSFCVNDARSRVWFLVEPPAPHVILIARGFRSARRDIRKSRLLNPWTRLGPTRVLMYDVCAHLFSPGREELEGVERSSSLLKLFDQLHYEQTNGSAQ